MKRLLFDLEGNGLLPDLTKLHCIAAYDVDTKEHVGAWGPDEIPQALNVLSQADILIAHHGLGYDFPALEKVHSFVVPTEKQRDTVVIARLRFPNIKELDSKFNATQLKHNRPTMGSEFGKHTIAAWGIRLGIPKLHTDIEDWSQWTAEMQERCVGDVATGARLWDYLKPDAMAQYPIELEHRVSRLCRMITEAGWPFDEEKAHKLHAQLVEERDKLEKELKAQFGSWTVETPFTPKVNNAKRGYVKGVPTKKIKLIEFNPRSNQHIERCLRKAGWEPTEFTDSGQAKLDEEQLENVGALYPEAKPLVRYKMLTKRLGQLADGEQAWLKNVGPDGKMHPQFNPIGAVTMRMSHFSPNISQVPAVASEFGHECRELFYVPAEWGVELGADMAGLEGRCFAHYLARYDAGAYGEAFLKGDPHWKTVLAIGFVPTETERDKENPLHTIVREQGGKRLFYGILYGCGDEKAGRIVLDCARLAAKQGYPELLSTFFGGEESPGSRTLKKVGGKAKFDVIHGIEGFDKLKQVIGRYASTGYLPGLDGRRIPVRSEHSALNTLLQSAGAIACKLWICDAYDALLAAGYKWGWQNDFVFLAPIHDEVQIAVKRDADKVGQIIVDCARQAGVRFSFRVPLDSEFKTGHNWAQCH